MTDLNLQIPGYHIERELGRGGMAIVYLALQESLDRQVALKVIKPALTADEEFAHRFMREGRIIASLTNPHIVTVYDIAAHEGLYYLSMEYLPGETLKEHIQAGLSVDQALDIIRALASALNYAHQRGVIHRDIKPQNILFRENGQPVLTDFGIAKTLGGSTIMTRTGLSLGTPRYMSPEQIRGQKTDSRADLYSLGVLFYEILTGDVPYNAEDSFALAMMHVTAPIPPLPPALQRFQPVLDRLLEKEADQRFQTAQEFLTALEHPETLPARPLNVADVTSAHAVPAGLSPPQPRPAAYRSHRSAFIAAAVLAGTALAGGGYFYWASLPRAPLPPPTPTITETPTAPPARQPTEVLLTQARQHQQAGDLAQSRALVEQGLRLAPDHPELTALRTELEHQQAQLEQQQQTERQVERLFEQAQTAYRDGELETSLARVDQGLQTLPHHIGLLALKQQIQDQQLQRQKQEAVRQQALTEKQHQAQLSRLRAESEKRHQMELDRLRAELEVQQRHVEQERQRAELERQRAQAEQERRRAEVERQRAQAEQARQRAEAEQTRRVEVEEQQPTSAQQRAAAEEQRRAEAEERQRLEQERQRIAAERRKAEQERQRIAEERRQIEQERQKAEDEDRRRAEAEAQEQRRAEQERQRIAEGERRKAEQERQRIAEERQQAEAQEQRRAEQERQRIAAAAEERRKTEQMQRHMEAEEQDRMRAEAEEQQRREDQERARLRASRSAAPAPAPSTYSTETGLPPISLVSPDSVSSDAPRSSARRSDSEVDSGFDSGSRQPAASSPSLLTARQAWEQVRTSQNPAALEQFIADYPKERKLIASARARLKQLQANPALSVRLAVRSNQKGTEVLINGQPAGVTPFSVELQPGIYQLQVQRPGYEEWSKEVTLTPEDEEVRLTVPLLRKRAQSSDKATPPATAQARARSAPEPKSEPKLEAAAEAETNAAPAARSGAANCLQGNCRDGQGVYRHANGSEYQGSFRNSKMHGQGTYTYTNGEKYVGEWRNNQINGQGVYDYRSGNRYEGAWRNGRKHGQGTYTYANGDQYVGDFANDQPNGQGIYTYRNGDRYEGEWRNGQKDGQGVLYENGKRVVGEWRNNQKFQVQEE